MLPHATNVVGLMLQISARGDFELERGRNFSPERALEAVGDRWGLLVIREAMFSGVRRFGEFELATGIAPDILATRIDALIGAGLMERAPGKEPKYLLTNQGHNLEPVIIALTTWSDGWAAPQGPPIAFAQHDPVLAAIVETQLDAAAEVDPPPVIVEISLLGAFSVRVAGKVIGELSVGSQRLLVFLALHHRAVTRIAMAGRMWPDATDERAGISLRSALSRLDTSTREAILSASAGLSLLETVAVDLREAQALARRLLQPGGTTEEADLAPAAVAVLSSELLPDWYDDWVLAEAEDWRQLRMSALEAQAAQLIAMGRLGEAAGAARAAMKVEPLRESASATLIRVHIAEGNQSEALRVYDRYTDLLKSVLGLEPTSRLTNLVAGLRN
jgi:DNA-binding SARP family transcriptional activator/DNA-binding HxlR family transcriptional regulator